MFYQNSVVKPSPWGPGEQLGWLALGGLEWNLPVIEHGYDWGIPWGFLPNQHSAELASVTVFTPREGRLINASITISLLAGVASFDVESTISNLGVSDLAFDYWQTAMLAPGKTNRPSSDLSIVVPTNQVMVHSTGDPTLPSPQVPFGWPVHAERNLSHLGTWEQYLGFFEYPAANGPFIGVYDAAENAGAVRIFPADIVRGSKVFGLGWNQPLPSDYFTDDDSAYVELHGGLAPSFFEHYFLPAGGSVSWREVWYPVQQIDGLSYASEVGALYLTRNADRLHAGYYPTRPTDGELVVIVNRTDGEQHEIARQAISAQPNLPFRGIIASTKQLGNDARVTVRLEDSAGRQLMEYQ